MPTSPKEPVSYPNMTYATHYRLTYEEHVQIDQGFYVDPDRYKANHRDYHPEMLCRTGNFHAQGTRDPSKVTCIHCQKKLAQHTPPQTLEPEETTCQVFATCFRKAVTQVPRGPGGIQRGQPLPSCAPCASYVAAQFKEAGRETEYLSFLRDLETKDLPSSTPENPRSPIPHTGGSSNLSRTHEKPGSEE